MRPIHASTHATPRPQNTKPAGPPPTSKNLIALVPLGWGPLNVILNTLSMGMLNGGSREHVEPARVPSFIQCRMARQRRSSKNIPMEVDVTMRCTCTIWSTWYVRAVLTANTTPATRYRPKRRASPFGHTHPNSERMPNRRPPVCACHESAMANDH
jgi:hypothetical protein